MCNIILDDNKEDNEGITFYDVEEVEFISSIEGDFEYLGSVSLADCATTNIEVANLSSYSFKVMEYEDSNELIIKKAR